MTKKHFIELAKVVYHLKPTTDSSADGVFVLPESLVFAMNQWEGTRDALADFCKSQNHNFDRARWLGYIAGENGPNGGKR